MTEVAAVPEHEPPQVLELDDRVVSKSCCLITLLALNSNANVGRLDHIDIVETITYGQCQFPIIEQVLDQVHDLGLLLWRRSIQDNRVRFEQDLTLEAVDNTDFKAICNVECLARDQD